jgi:methylenetetrahydrofolate dehydrogenase (NADP+)/methenyltetrahydrofolate cyclohydrolase
MKILDGKETSLKITQEIKGKVQTHISSGKRPPRLEIVLVGDDFGSQKYVEMKSKKAQELGIQCNVNKLDTATTKDLIQLIEKINSDSQIDGVMVQLPLPEGIDENLVLESISPSKDVDGLTSVNLGKLFKNDPTAISPATPKGILSLLHHYNIEIDGRNAVVIGRSDIVGLPVAAMLQNENATVTICHSHTKNLKEICKEADILVVGIGKGEYINSEYIKQGRVVIDVGTNRNEQGKLVGDVDFESIKDMVEYITPVPGGVGPMTIASLLSNLIDIYERNE